MKKKYFLPRIILTSIFILTGLPDIFALAPSGIKNTNLFLKSLNSDFPAHKRNIFLSHEIDIIVDFWYHYYEQVLKKTEHPFTIESIYRAVSLYNESLFKNAIKYDISIQIMLKKMKTKTIAPFDYDKDFNLDSNYKYKLFMSDINLICSEKRSWPDRYLNYHKDLTLPLLKEHFKKSSQIRILMPGDMMGIQSLVILDLIAQILAQKGQSILSENFKIEIIVEDLPEIINKLDDFIYSGKDLESFRHSDLLFRENGIQSVVVGKIYKLSSFARKLIKFKTVDLNKVDPESHNKNPFNFIFIARTVEHLILKINAYNYLFHSLNKTGRLLFVEGFLGREGRGLNKFNEIYRDKADSTVSIFSISS